MNLTVLGATGRTGRHLVDELLARGHHVTALVRDPTTYAAPDGVTVVAGHSRDAAALAAAVARVEAVVSALGPAAKDATLHRDTGRALIPVMTDHGVHRFVGDSGAGIDVPNDAKNRSAGRSRGRSACSAGRWRATSCRSTPSTLHPSSPHGSRRDPSRHRTAAHAPRPGAAAAYVSTASARDARIVCAIQRDRGP